MRLKRIYKQGVPPDDMIKRYDYNTKETKMVPPVDHVIIESMPKNKKWNVSTRVAMQGQKEGYLIRAGDVFNLMTDRGSIPFKILKEPGYYCCHCGEQMADGVMARGHLEMEHSSENSPDKQNPSGYAKLNCYELECQGEY